MAEWSYDTIFDLFWASSSSYDIELFDYNGGANGTCGLGGPTTSSIPSDPKYGYHILKAKAKYNNQNTVDVCKTSNGRRATYCQEAGHALGFAHSNDGGCMGYLYWNNSYSVVQHNIDDVYNKYHVGHCHQSCTGTQPEPPSTSPDETLPPLEPTVAPVSGGTP